MDLLTATCISCSEALVSVELIAAIEPGGEIPVAPSGIVGLVVMVALVLVCCLQAFWIVVLRKHLSAGLVDEATVPQGKNSAGRSAGHPSAGKSAVVGDAAVDEESASGVRYSHDLNNLLLVAVNSIQMARSFHEIDDREQTLQSISEADEALERIAERIAEKQGQKRKSIIVAAPESFSEEGSFDSFTSGAARVEAASAAKLDTQFDGNVEATTSAKIALVDDEEVVRESLGILLDSMGNEVTEYEGGLALLECLQSNPDAYNLAIIDWTMPEFSGRELLVELRKRHPELPVVISTGHALTNEQLMSSIGVQADLIIGKPFSRDELSQAISLVRSS